MYSLVKLAGLAAALVLIVAVSAKTDAKADANLDTAPAVKNACPNLAGTYSCKTNKGASELIVSQQIVNNQTIYTTIQDGDETQSPSDNYEYSINDIESSITGSARFVCENGAFVTYTKMQKTDENKAVVATSDLKRSLSLDAQKNLQIAVQAQMTVQGRTMPQNGTSICNRVGK